MSDKANKPGTREKSVTLTEVKTVKQAKEKVKEKKPFKKVKSLSLHDIGEDDFVRRTKLKNTTRNIGG